MNKKFIKIIFILMLMVCCLGNNKNENQKEKIYKNIYIENIEMSEITQREAINILKKSYPLENINLKYEGKTWTIHPNDINLKYKIKEATDKAIEYTRTNKKTENLKRKTKLILGERHYISLDVEYDEEKLSQIINLISEKINKEYVDATLIIYDDNEFKKSPSKEGKLVQKKELQNKLNELIMNKNIMDVNIPVEVIKPKIKTSDIESINYILGQFSTSFNKNTSRGSNIYTAGKSSGDIILMPQEIYSYNKATGPRIISNGYKYAPVIIGKKYTNGEGGGVCQVSTTIYNAALLSGLEIIEIHNHTYISNYICAGRDATVSYGYYDLKFKNPYSHPIYIKNILKNGIITTKIYGCKEDLQNIYIKTEYEYKKEKIIAKTYRVYLNQNNKKIKEELIYISNYDKNK